MLTTEQLTILAAAIRADTDPAVQAALAIRNDVALAELYNAPASPAYVVWRNRVSLSDIGAAVNYVAVEAMTDANRAKIPTFFTMNPTGCDPSRADVRSYWANTFSGALGGQGQATRDALEALWRRNASKAEKLFSTGTGTTATPATYTLANPLELTISDISGALNEV